MKCFLKLAFFIAILISACGVNVYGAINLRGDGSIDFDGTGDLFLNRIPPLTVARYKSNCTPSTIPGIVFLCHELLDMSLLGNDIVRAEHVRVQISLHDLSLGFSLRFGPCPNCGTSVSVDEDDLVLGSGGLRLSNPKIQALQALIDQRGASSVYMSIALQGGSVALFSSIQAVAVDIKPADVPNTLNPRSNGVVAVAILTTERVDAISIDVTSLRFGATGEDAGAVRSVFEDVDDDGDTDLLVFFRSRHTGIDCDTLFAYISGATLMGEDIAGTDSVSIVGCH